MATCGILNNTKCREVFERINDHPLCAKCHKDRPSFLTKDQKEYSRTSNLVPGFSSEEVNIPLDLLIVAEAHGGGGKEYFHEQRSLSEEVSSMANYYLHKKIIKFHQDQMRELLKYLNSNGIKWVFTDLIKCYVWQGKDKDAGLFGRNNKKMAIDCCRKYLDEQINVLNPKQILALGKAVAEEYFELPESEHGNIYTYKNKRLVFSIFPSRNTADLWVKNNGWKEIKNKIHK